MSFLSVLSISKEQQGEEVLKEISFEVTQFQKIAIAGETGSGKSTLLKIIAGLIQAGKGKVLFEGERVLGPEEKLLPGHPAIAYLSQHFELRNNYRVEELLEMANRMDDAEASLIYEVCRIEHLLKRKTDQLSGGEKQRIAIARLLISSPKLLLLDEPYSNLDMIHRTILKSVINDIGEMLGITCMLISHDPADTLSWADEIIVMKAGRIIQQATPGVIYKNPVDEYAAGLFGKYTILNEELQKKFELSPSTKPTKFYRPENFKLLEGTQKGIEAKVKDIKFYGAYYEVEAIVNGQVINIRTTENNYKIDQLISISL